MTEFCRDLPLAVICEMLGLPAQDHARFKSWLGGLKDTADIGAVIRAIPGVISVVRYLRLASRPGGGALPDGLVAALRDVETDSGRLSEDELVSMIFLLFGAGQETTTHLISGGLFALLSHEDHPSDFRRPFRAALARGSDRAPAQRSQPDANLRRGVPAPCLSCADDETALRDPRRRSARAAVPARRHVRRAPGRGELRSRQFRGSAPVRHHAAPQPAPVLRHGCALLSRLPTCSGRGSIGFERILVRFPDMRLRTNLGPITWHKRLGIRTLAGLPVRLMA
jgi:cytochrome P450 PksS